ncbi:hypothetical protein [Streptomyces mobaraensis]|uniref:WXG100 family type VII secretion target n=1 Tax=Streptomyces mobaraensis TaxID=35621 RepID=A0A5N5WE71_STRMB|nr:hypothetical protein [Streptomyces mobaraensis]KAB7850230.1 hypothetical protein FRZ00_06455 [Streptomyces mobaraensis]
MVTVPDLHDAKPQLWRDAADDVLRAAKHCEEIGGLARDRVAATLRQCWIGDGGEAARKTFVQHAGDYEAAALSLRALTKAYDDLAEAIENAQRDLTSALDYARSNDLHVDESGRVQLAHAVATAPGDTTHTDRISHAQGIINDALTKAAAADVKAADAIRAVKGLTEIKDPAMVKEALVPGSPLNVALRLANGPGGLHPVNVGAAQLAAVDRAARETGMSKTLLLAILWQEQQWYQNHDKDPNSLLGRFGRVFDWSLEETIKPDKSLGITHMKLKTAREVIRNHDKDFTVGGQRLSDLSDAQLTKYIEENPNEDIRLSAYLLQDLKKNPYGARTDKHLFLLYAADTPQVREANERYGDDTDSRGGAIRHRASNWDKLQPHLTDAQRWESFTDEQRAQALKQLESQTPKGHHFDLGPLFDTGGRTTGTGSGEPKPGTPSPEPGPAPTPPK